MVIIYEEVSALGWLAEVTNDTSVFLWRRGGTIEDELGDLTTLYACAVSALAGTLELERDAANRHLTQPFLSKVTQLSSVQHC